MANNYKAQTEVDISYHYPPELLELLCDAVPALFRSKQGVGPAPLWWTGSNLNRSASLW